MTDKSTPGSNARLMLTRDLISNAKALLVIVSHYQRKHQVDDTDRFINRTWEIINMLEEELHCADT